MVDLWGGYLVSRLENNLNKSLSAKKARQVAAIRVQVVNHSAVIQPISKTAH
jgi:hypothetical protein